MQEMRGSANLLLLFGDTLHFPKRLRVDKIDVQLKLHPVHHAAGQDAMAVSTISSR